MFGSVESTKPLADFIEVSFPGEWGQEDKDGSGIKVIRTTNFTNNGKLNLSDVVTRDIDSVKVEKKKLSKGDIILERSGGTNENPVGRVVYFEEDGVYLFNNFTQLLRCKEGVNSLFIFYSLFNYYQINKNVIRSMGNKTTGIQNLKMDRYWQIPIADVSIVLQKEFESIYRQADKSGFDGLKSQFIEMFDFHELNLNSPSKDFESMCFDDTSSATKIPAGDYLQVGKYVIYDQAQEKDVAGYSNTEQGLCRKYPAILFGDHSRVVKYINEPFFIGADGVKIIRPKEDNLIPEFLYYDLKYHTIPNTGYNRHFKYIKMIRLTKASLEEQSRFLSIAHQADKSGNYVKYII